MEVMNSVGESILDEEATKMIEITDSDKDGKVNFDEFVKMVHEVMSKKKNLV